MGAGTREPNVNVPTAEAGPFDGGPPFRLEEWLHLRRPGQHRAGRETLIAAGVGWLPLALLAAVHGDFIWAGVPGPFLLDIAAHARYLVALPALILAESVCIPRLGTLARDFVDSGLLRDPDRPRFEAAITSTRRLRDSVFPEIAVFLLAYSIVVALVYPLPIHLTPEWQLGAGTGLGARSPAGWWHVLISLPLLLMLLLGWIWRVVLWTRFLWLMSRLNLRLLASHPDRCAGLHFAGHSLSAFALPAFAMGAIVAGGIATRVVNDGATLLDFKYLVLGLVIFVVILFASPPLVFFAKLLAHRRRGSLEYGAVATRVGREFEREWVERSQSFGANPLQTQAFSATTDLYQVVAKVYEMRLVPIDMRGILSLVAAAVLPLFPVLLLVLPFDVLFNKLMGLLI
jgi:hypothetical protein